MDEDVAALESRPLKERFILDQAKDLKLQRQGYVTLLMIGSEHVSASHAMAILRDIYDSDDDPTTVQAKLDKAFKVLYNLVRIEQYA